jgi:glycosyltransferase involved in cell wall biosynthesis
MRILVYPHELAMGGSQINALELAGAVRDLGHEVVVFATDGVLREKVRDLRLDFVEAPPRKHAVDPMTIRRLTETVKERNIDLVHSYEWFPCVDVAFGPALFCKTPAVMTVMSMDVPDFLPRHMPLIVGTHALAAQETRKRNGVHVVEPPVDTSHHRPVNMQESRRQLRIPSERLVISIVGRLTTDLEKLEGVLAAIVVVDRLAHELPVTLVVAGGGEGLSQVQAAAEDVNQKHGCEVVRVQGNVTDPRPVYDAADVVLGMGSSALRGMAYGKPLVVQGTAGFWRLSHPTTEKQFLQDGWFGLGAGGNGADELERILRVLAADATLRSTLSCYGRRLVEERFSLEQAARRLISIYANASSNGQPARIRHASLVRTAYEVSKFRAVMILRAAGLYPLIPGSST